MKSPKCKFTWRLRSIDLRQPLSQANEQNSIKIELWRGVRQLGVFVMGKGCVKWLPGKGTGQHYHLNLQEFADLLDRNLKR
jgi:hypothetical protein